MIVGASEEGVEFHVSNWTEGEQSEAAAHIERAVAEVRKMRAAARATTLKVRKMREPQEEPVICPKCGSSDVIDDECQTCAEALADEDLKICATCRSALVDGDCETCAEIAREEQASEAPQEEP